MTASALRDEVSPRPPDVVMRLDRLGSAHQTRLSFLRALLRRVQSKHWRIASASFRSRRARCRHGDLHGRGRGQNLQPRRLRSRARAREAHGSRDRGSMGRDLRALRRCARPGGNRAPRRERAETGGRALSRDRARACSRQPQRAPLRSRARRARRGEPARRGLGRGGRLSDAHHRGLRQRQIRHRRPRPDRGASGIVRSLPRRDAHRLPHPPVHSRSRRAYGEAARRRLRREARPGLAPPLRHRQCDGARHGALSREASGLARPLDRGARDGARARARAAAGGSRFRRGLSCRARKLAPPRRCLEDRGRDSEPAHPRARRGFSSSSTASRRNASSRRPGHGMRSIASRRKTLRSKARNMP